MWLTVLLLLVLLLLVYLLLAPVSLVIDTVSQSYYVRFPGIFILSLEPLEEELLRLKLDVFFRHFYFYPLRPRPSKKQKKKKSKSGSFKFSPKTGLKILKSFTVRKFYLNVDTGDFCTNAKLYPIIGVLNSGTTTIAINYEGKNQLALHLMNRPIRIIKSVINF